MFDGFQITLSFFGASITLARQPEQQWTTHPKNAGDPLPTRQGRPKKRRRFPIRPGLLSQSAKPKRPGWRRWLRPPG